MSPLSHYLQPQSPVPPGRDTGLYYINVAGLPWQCSWKHLKDLARSAQTDESSINVEYAVVYPGSTNGWVSVRGGRADFRKVLARLDGGVLDNRSLIADGRNETEWVYLRDVSASQPRPQRPDRISTRGPSMHYSYACEQQVALCSYTCTPSNPSLGWSFPLISENGGYHSIIPTGFTSAMMPPPNLATKYHPRAPIQIVSAETHKIIIKKLPCDISEPYLYDFLQHMLPQDCRTIQSVKIARHSPREPKRHAFVTFNSYAAAQTAVATIHESWFWGGYLQARLVREGVSPRRHTPSQLLSSRKKDTLNSPALVSTRSFSSGSGYMASPVLSSMGDSDSASSTESDLPLNSEGILQITPPVVDGSSGVVGHKTCPLNADS